ncbi:MAG TPA: class I adenylate-forming enzyme family protein [Candidatus Methanoculleus thermohydrogenotrophicum]|jgi:long-chain acyl-CoA synthetase|nr:class I adenylate-forming enzyme family protein [Candidatus Methanoculleus thermohydrogenotrophicum]NLM82625.1 acyl--CoA ligase [Candidatus Methanoculleus thermohydrogenotrophicum]HOB17695.1 class I adenylate-forming enzyme family protein [Candidatus Methanoculleus thermohydrogenotrophicum]HPZ37948.1 class I adenylate-forming enzyme family protein [Candidatus Methanoculleus thermohydrogenotrophicum]HQC91131.1 class I adenylate-forming enzyme family protein [Candidatus Methanoculleus thermohy
MPNCTTFLDANAHYGAKPALVVPSRGESYTYAELQDRVSRIGRGLLDLGIEHGDRVCIYLESSPEFLISYLALWRIGAVAVPTNRVYREGEVLYTIRDAGATAVITDAEGAALVDRIRDRTPTLRHVIPVGGETWADLLRAPADLRAANCRFDDLCQIQYTSGTTGRPKGAMLTHGNWIAAMDAERDVLGLTPDDVYLGIYPMGHVGISWGLSTLRAGGTYVVMERFDLDRYLDLAREYQATVVAGMPPVIHSLLQTPAGTEAALATVRVMISGGGPLMPGIWKPFHERFGIPIVNAYGLSETIVVGTGTAIRPEHYATADEFRSVGTPVGYSEVKIVDANDPGRELGPGVDGEIALRGPAVASGYWQMPEETRAVFLPDGWFLTGDIGHLDEDGMLYITDRKKDMIVMSGWKIYPTEVENVLVQHPGVRDAAVFGCPDERRGEIPVAVVVSSSNGIAPDDVISFARDHLAGYKVPRRVIIADDIPRVNGWKLLRKRLREEYCASGSQTG